VSPRGGDPNATSRGERFAPTRARWWKTKASSVFTGVVYEPIRAIPRHQDCPKTGGKTSRLGIALMSFLVVLPPYFFLNIKLPFWDIDGATPTHSPKSGWECSRRWRNSLISPDVHQPT